MKHGDLYEHYKGVEYFFDRIALPFQSLPLLEQRKAVYIGTARYHEDTHDMDLYTIGAVTFIDNTDVPHVIYQSEKHYDTEFVFAREIDDFFGYVFPVNEQPRRRFALK